MLGGRSPLGRLSVIKVPGLATRAAQHPPNQTSAGPHSSSPLQTDSAPSTQSELKKQKSKLDDPIKAIIDENTEFYKTSLLQLMKSMSMINDPATPAMVINEIKKILKNTMLYLKSKNTSPEADLAAVLFDHLRTKFFTPILLNQNKPLLSPVRLIPSQKNYWRYVYRLLLDSDPGFRLIQEEMGNAISCFRFFLKIATNNDDPAEAKVLEELRDERERLKQMQSDPKTVYDEKDPVIPIATRLVQIKESIESLEKEPTCPDSLKGVSASQLGLTCLSPELQNMLSFMGRFEKHLLLKKKPCVENRTDKPKGVILENEETFLADYKSLKQCSQDIVKKLLLQMTDSAATELKDTIQVDFNTLRLKHLALVVSLFPQGNPGDDILTAIRVGFHLLLQRHKLTETYHHFKAECIRRDTGPRFAV